jgi:hypothetical protein
MHHRIAASIIVVSLALVALPAVAQQPAPMTPPPSQMQPTLTEQDCPKYIAAINKEISIRYDPAAANARQAIADATKLQTDKKYADCVATAEKTLTALGVKR